MTFSVSHIHFSSCSFSKNGVQCENNSNLTMNTNSGINVFLKIAVKIADTNHQPTGLQICFRFLPLARA